MAGSAMAQRTTFPTTIVDGDNIFIQDSVLLYDGNGILSKNTRNTFDDKGNITMSEQMAWDPIWEMYEYISKTEYEYDGNGNLAKETSYNNILQGDGSGNIEWQVYNYKDYFWSNGRMDSVLNHRKSNEGEYFVCDKNIRHYDKDGRLTKSETYVRWNIESTLNLSSINEYLDYNKWNKPGCCRISNMFEGECTSMYMERYTYDENGNMTVLDNNTVNLEDNSETLRTQTEFEYNSNNQVIKEIFNNTDIYTGEWGPFFRWEFEYNEDKTLGIQNYYVYSMDFTESPLYESKKYNWTKINTGSISETSQEGILRITVNSTIDLSYNGKLYRAMLVDLNGRTMQTMTAAGENSCSFTTDNLIPGTYIVVACGDKGNRACKVSVSR